MELPVPNECISQTASSLEEKRRALAEEMRESEFPHKVNRKLNQLERENGYCELLSFPISVTFWMANKCNAECRFCGYARNSEKLRYVSLAQVKKMTWLRYISYLCLFSGASESQMNPEFTDIHDHLLCEYPHLVTHLQTNGIRLDKRAAEAFANRLGTLVVSLHAARAKTWEYLVKARRFERIVENLRYLSSLRKPGEARKPKIILAFVLNKHNIRETVEFVELAHSVGADLVRFVHMQLPQKTTEDKLGADSSLHQHKEESDHWLRQAGQRAAELQVPIERPSFYFEETFSKPARFVIKKGKRYAVADDDKGPTVYRGCYDPWRVFGFPVHGNARFCCKGTRTERFDIDNLDENAFLELWNSEFARELRRTVNLPGGNKLCDLCQTEDLSDPHVRAVHVKLTRANSKAPGDFSVYLDG